MAIDDMIAAGIRPPQVEDATTMYGRLMQIQAQRQAMKAGEMTLQSNALTLQKARQEAEDERKYRAIVSQIAGGSSAQQPQDDPGPYASAPAPAAPAGTPAAPAGTPTVPGTNTPRASFDYDRTIQALRAAGLHGYADKLATTAADQRFKAAETHKNDAAGNNDQASADEKRNAMVYNGTAHLLSLQTPEARAAAYPQVRAFLHDQGHIDAAKLPEAYPGDDWLKGQHEMAGSQTARDAEAKAARDAKLFGSQLTEAQAKADETRAKADDATRATAATALEAAYTQGGPAAYTAALAQLPPKVGAAFPGAPATVDAIRQGGMTAEQRTQATHNAATLANTKEYQKKVIGIRQGEFGLARDRDEMQKRVADPYGYLGINKKPISGGSSTGAEFLATLPPAMAARVQSVSEGREVMTARDKTSPQGKQILDAVYQYDHSWNEQRGQLRKAFMSGPDGRNIGNLNTSAVHLDQMHEAAKAMNNGSWTPGNQLYNYIATKFGAAAPTNYQFVMQAFAGEAASALKGNATDPEIAHVISTLDGAQAPGQAEGVALTALHTLGAKLNTYTERFHAVNKDDPWTPVLPTAQEVFTRYGIDPTAGPKGGARGPAGGATGGNRPALDSFWKK